MLCNLDLNSSYTSEDDDIYKDFFVPALKNSIEYKRAVGFFSLGVLLNVPAAMSQIVENDGGIKLIFAKLVSPEDFQAIKNGMEYSWSTTLPNFSEIVADNPSTLLEYRIRLLAYLFSTKKLELKIALRPKGMFHQKIGIVSDKIGNQVSFNGSMNETIYALNPEYNSEEITVFKSWVDGQKTYVDKHSSDFDKLWNNDTKGKTVVCDLPEALTEGLNMVSEQFSDKPDSIEETAKVAAFFKKRTERTPSIPTIPLSINGNPFSIRDHQRLALEEWQKNDYTGILELATGTGKTITSIYAAVKLADKNEGLSLVVIVPYLSLADQWCDELGLFNINAIKCYGSRADWTDQISDYFSRNIKDQKEFLAIVVVNKTFKSDHFQESLISLNLEKTMVIGDECHHHGSKSFENKLPINARFKLGLSATPFHYIDDDANERLRAFYGHVVYEYSLFDAIKNGILTPYEYVPIPIVLTTEESDKYHELSDRIAKASASSGKTKDSGPNERVKALLGERSRLIGTASNKLVRLEELIVEEAIPNHSLFYCSDGSVIEDEEEDINDIIMSQNDNDEVKQRVAVAKMLKSKQVSASPFTASETPYQRKEILRMFKDKEVKALIAIKCLDEGIDVPACATAYLLASSRNPRQFIQRRGRILRKAPGKDKAKIYDFVVMLPPNNLADNKRETDFFKNELIRVADFAKHSLNPLTSIKPLKPWLEIYELQHLII